MEAGAPPQGWPTLRAAGPEAEARRLALIAELRAPAVRPPAVEAGPLARRVAAEAERLVLARNGGVASARALEAELRSAVQGLPPRWALTADGPAARALAESPYLAAAGDGWRAARAWDPAVTCAWRQGGGLGVPHLCAAAALGADELARRLAAGELFAFSFAPPGRRPERDADLRALVTGGWPARGEAALRQVADLARRRPRAPRAVEPAARPPPDADADPEGPQAPKARAKRPCFRN